MILTIADIKKYVPANVQSFADNLEFAESRALIKFFPRMLGSALTLAVAEATAPAELMAKVKPVLANLAYLLATPFVDVISTASGFAVTRNNNLAPASRERVDAFMKGCQAAANDFADDMLLFLETNKDDPAYSTWNKSCLLEGSIIENVYDIDQFVDVYTSRFLFIALKRRIESLERSWLRNELSPEFLAELQQGQHPVPGAMIAEALTYKVMHSAPEYKKPDNYMDEFQQRAKCRMDEALEYLQDNLDTYPTYRDNGYVAPYKNSDDFEGENYHG